jgi:hypothetical protein
VNRTKSNLIRESNPELKRILEVLFPEKTVHFGSTVPGKNSAFWKYCSQKKQRILEVLFPEKTSALIAGERSSAHAGPILPFLIFRVQYFHFVIFL